MMLLYTFLLVLPVVSFSLQTKMGNLNRDSLITSAIQEVQMQFAALQEQHSVSNTREKLHAFKKATPAALAQGNANLKFENMVKVAEKKIIGNQRRLKAQSLTSIAEALAMKLWHSPGSFLDQDEIARIYEASGCPNVVSPPNCSTQSDSSHYTPDGTCNNLANAARGAANTPLRRLVPARYDDGMSQARGFLQSQGSKLFQNGVFGGPNPSPRIAGTEFVKDKNVTDSLHTHMLMQWGQFMDHDITAVPEYENCPETCDITDTDEGRCYPFPVPENDKNVSVTLASSKRCHAFRRSLGACPVSGQTVSPREQLNSITHFIDGSNIYGSSAEVLEKIRDQTSDAGLLRTGTPAKGSTRPLLPDAAADSFVVCPKGSPKPCFLSGDLRVNEQSGLTSMHTLWMREHNRIARQLKTNNPTSSSDQIFQTARSIVAAQYQKITFSDFLPILLGDSHASLIPAYSSYDDKIDPSIPNAFAAAAYRFGHSQIQPYLARLDENYNPSPEGPLSLVDAFFDTSHVRQFGTDSILRGLLVRPSMQVDQYMNSFLTNHLFADDAETPGLDLASLNIQRGRDHGLPKYFIWKQWAKEQCKIESNFRSPVTPKSFTQIYGDLSNVDLFVGGLSEEALPNGLLGATFACIISKAFLGLRDGDRFFYKNPSVFTPEQRKALEKASLSRVICDNTDITSLQANAFLASQKRELCSNIPSLDLSLWHVKAVSETPTQPVSLPETCYIKLHTDKRDVYFSTSSRDETSNFDFNQKLTAPDQQYCFSVKCPTSGGKTILAVGGRQDTSCTPSHNPAIPDTLTELPGSSIAVTKSVYIQKFSAGDFVRDGNGLFNSLDTCESSSDIALEYNCFQNAIAARHDAARHNVDDLLESIAAQANPRANPRADNLASATSAPVTSPPPLPDTCYIKFHTDRRDVYFIINGKVGSTEFDFNQKLISPDTSHCFSISCPQAGAEIIFALGAWQESNCAPTHNSALPDTLNSIPGSSIIVTKSVYIQKLSVGDFSNTGAGLYTSQAACESSPAVALEYDCLSEQARAVEWKEVGRDGGALPHC